VDPDPAEVVPNARLEESPFGGRKWVTRAKAQCIDVDLPWARLSLTRQFAVEFVIRIATLRELGSRHTRVDRAGHDPIGSVVSIPLERI
jgi:hypothetical protein